MIEIKQKLRGQQANTIDDEYDIGYYNGIELALSLIEGKKANFKYRKQNGT